MAPTSSPWPLSEDLLIQLLADCHRQGRLSPWSPHQAHCLCPRPPDSAACLSEIGNLTGTDNLNGIIKDDSAHGPHMKPMAPV